MGGLIGYSVGLPQLAWTASNPAMYAPPSVSQPPAVDRLGKRIFHGLGTFADRYLALSDNHAASEDPEAEQHAAEQAALLRAQSLRMVGSPYGFSIAGMAPAAAPGFAPR